MNHRHRWWVTLLVVAAVAAVAASASTGSAKAAKYMTVSQGAGAAALAGYTPFDPTDPSTPETVTFVLRARNVESSPVAGAGRHARRLLSTSDFANRYGQPKPVVLAIQAYLAHYGIHSHAMPDNLDIQSTGTAGQYNNAFQIVQQNYMVPPSDAHGSHGHGHGTITVHGSSQNPKVPSDWGPFILAILGLSNYPTQQSDMIGTADGVSTQGLNNTALHPSDFATRYNLDPVTAAGGTGHGRTIGIVTLAADRPDTVSQFWNDIGLTGSQASQSRITTINVDGGPGAPNENAGSDETTLDMEQSGALAPDANLSVYQAPNTDAGFVDAFYQAAADNTADTVSASWGESETLIKAFTNIGLEDPNYANAFSQAFLEMDAQGQSMFLSSGDSGAYPASRDLGSTDRTAGNPDDSPWATSSGGTTLPGPFQVHDLTFNFPTERTVGMGLPLGAAERRARRAGDRLRRVPRRRRRRRLQRLLLDALVPEGRQGDRELTARSSTCNRQPSRRRTRSSGSTSGSACRTTGTSTRRRMSPRPVRATPVVRRPTCRPTRTRKRATSCCTTSATRRIRVLRRRSSSSAGRASSHRS